MRAAVASRFRRSACCAPRCCRRSTAYAGQTYQHADALGTPVFQTNSAGTTLDANRRPLEPYGEPSNKVFFDGPDFTGHMSDELTKLVYMQAHYYDPVQSRFVSTDPVSSSPDSFNRYWYAKNSPYNNIDPDGRKACTFEINCETTLDGLRRRPSNYPVFQLAEDDDKAPVTLEEVAVYAAKARDVAGNGLDITEISLSAYMLSTPSDWFLADGGSGDLTLCGSD